MKNKKRVLFAVLSVACVVLLFSLTSFADETSHVLTDQEFRSLYVEANNFDQTDPLFYLLTGGDYNFHTMPYIAQFTLDDYDIEPMDYVTSNSAPFINGIAVVYNSFTQQFIQLPPGYWATSHTTSSGNKFVYLDWNDSAGTRQMRIRWKFEQATGYFISCEVNITGVSGTLDYNYVTIGTAVSQSNILPLEYCVNNYFINAGTTFVNVDNARLLMSQTYDYGYSLGETYGYQDGYTAGNNNGYETGWDVGYNAGYGAGYDYGLTIGQSASVGENLLGETLSAPIEALKNFTLIEWTTSGGQEIVISLMSIFTAFVGISLFVWFLKLFAGG